MNSGSFLHRTSLLWSDCVLRFSIHRKTMQKITFLSSCFSYLHFNFKKISEGLALLCPSNKYSKAADTYLHRWTDCPSYSLGYKTEWEAGGGFLRTWGGGAFLFFLLQGRIGMGGVDGGHINTILEKSKEQIQCKDLSKHSVFLLSFCHVKNGTQTMFYL